MDSMHIDACVRTLVPSEKVCWRGLWLLMVSDGELPRLKQLNPVWMAV